MLRQVIVLGVDEARALHDSGKNHRASLLAEVVGIVLDVAVAVDFGAPPSMCPLFGGRAPCRVSDNPASTPHPARQGKAGEGLSG